MPNTIDGKSYPKIEFTHPIEYVVITTISINLMQAVLGLLLPEKYIRNKFARRFFQFNYFLLLVWQISKIEHFFYDAHPIWHFIYGLVAPLSSFLIVSFQLELLRIFRVLGYQITNRTLVIFGIVNLLIYFATAGSGYLRLLTIGRLPSLLVQNWYKFGYPIYIALALLFGNCQLVFMIKYLKRYIKLREDALAVDSVVSDTALVAEKRELEVKLLKRLLNGIIFSICVDICALIVWLSGWGYAFAVDDFFGQKLQVIGTDFGPFHLTSLAFCYYYTQQLFLKPKIKAKSGDKPVVMLVQKNALASSHDQVDLLNPTMKIDRPGIKE